MAVKARRKRTSARPPLAEYQRKRDFERTREPKGKSDTVPRPTHARKKRGLAYVIQKHAASHLHFDLRLELDGVMKSWAVPKGPSRDPKVKRLAMHVEDHPIEYNTFEGTIPKGQYGGGTVMIWDRGTYEGAEGDEDSLRSGYAKGSLKFTLHGERLQGSWALVRMKGPDSKEWLLIKHNDDAATAGDEFAEEASTSVVTGRTMDEIAEGDDAQWQSNRKPEKQRQRAVPDIHPMLATVSKEMPQGRDWVFEPKYDGIRVLAFVAGNAVALMTRNDHNKATQFPEIVEALSELSHGDRTFVLDGEIVARQGKSLARFQDLQGRIGQTSKAIIEGYAKKLPATFVVFDALLLDKESLVKEPWSVRRERLEQLLAGKLPSALRLAESSPNGSRLLAKAQKERWEGVMAKRVDAPYKPGVRTHDWRKIKIEGRQEFVVGGWTEPRRTRQHLGALLVGYYVGDDLMYAGHVGGGFTQGTLKSTYALLAPLEQKRSPFATDVDENEPAHWVKPRVVVEVKFNEWTSDGKLRQPVFLGVRDDKNAKEIVREELP